MGFQDALYVTHKLRIQEAIDFADRSMELISYYAIEASSDLAVERGHYTSFEGLYGVKGYYPLMLFNTSKNRPAPAYSKIRRNI